MIDMAFAQTTSGVEWMIADEAGNSILPVYSVLSVDVTMDGKAVSDPIEEGSFTTYNKTTSPISIDMEISFQGDKASLQEAVTKAKELKESVNTFSIVTPDYEFENMTLERLSYNMRVENGLGVLVVSLSCVEVKEVQAAYASVSQAAIQAAQCSNASNVSTVNTGQTTTSEPTKNEQEQAEPDKDLITQIGELGTGIWNSLTGSNQRNE